MTASLEVFSIFRQVIQYLDEMLPDVLNGRSRVDFKSDSSPVTKSDHLIERQVEAFLRGVLPGLTLIGEESFLGSVVPSTGYTAVLDPIDGTENFCSGLKEWGVSLGIWRNGCHLGSMLHMPELGETIISGQPVEKVPASRITGFSSSYTAAIGEGIKDATEYRVTGCAVYNLINVIRGSFCRFLNPKGAYIWDLLPGLMLALEHGCEVMLDGERFNGQFLDPNRTYRVDIRHRYDLHPRQGS